MSMVTIHRFVVFLSQVLTSQLFHVWFQPLLLDLHIGFSRGRSGGLVFPSLSEFSTVYCDFSSVQFSHSVVSDSLQPYESQYSRLPYPSPTPGACSNLCPLSQWCHPNISSSVVPFTSAFNISHHQGLFKGVSSLYQVAKVLEFQFQHHSFQ